MRHLIQNAEVHVDETWASYRPPAVPETRPKRSAHLAFADLVLPPPPSPGGSSSGGLSQSYDARTTYPPLQMDTSPTYPPMPRPDAYAGYVPQSGYDSWWPELDHPAEGEAGPGPSTAAHRHAHGSSSGERASTSARVPAGAEDEDVGMPVAGPSGEMAAHDFNFSQQHFSHEFLQAMRDPVLHFPSTFAHQYEEQ